MSVPTTTTPSIPRHRVARLGLAIALAALVLGACGSGKSDDDAPAAPAPAAAPDLSAPESVRLNYWWSLQDRCVQYQYDVNHGYAPSTAESHLVNLFARSFYGSLPVSSASGDQIHRLIAGSCLPPSGDAAATTTPAAPRTTILIAPGPHDTITPPTEPSTTEATTTTTTVPPIRVATTAPPSPTAAVPATTTVVNVTDGQLPQAMPDEVQGHRASGGLQTATVRVSADGKAHLIPDYAVQTNSCRTVFVTLRWTVADHSAQVVVGRADASAEDGATPIKALDPSSPATGGYWTGDYCQQPAFGMTGAGGDGSAEADLDVEYQWWMAGPG